MPRIGFLYKKRRRTNYKIASIFMILFILILTGCSKEEKEYDTEPLLGLHWFWDKNQVMQKVTSLELIGEREADGMTILDYEGAVLYDVNVSVSFSFTDRGLVGIDYHDTKHEVSYLEWQQKIENRYGVPNENALDSASWFEDPVGKDTSVYLFDLAEGVQISYFATADTPDKTFNTRMD